MKTIDVRARVSGYLEKVLFREGYDVKEGDVLFLIDPRTYQADYDRAVANLAQAKAHLARVEADYQRAETLIKTAAISQSDYDLALGNRNEAAAWSGWPRRRVNTAKLNLDFTKVTAPISGRISRQNIDPGNLVMADNTILTTVVSLDPIYAYFDVDEGTTLRFRRLMEAGKVKSGAGREVAGVPRAGRRGRQVSARGHDQFRRQPARSFHRHLAAAGDVRQPQEVPRPRHVRADPRAHRPDASGDPGHGAGHRLRPGPEVPLRAQREEPGRLSRGADRRFPETDCG